MIRTNPIQSNKGESSKIKIFLEDLINEMFYEMEESQWLTVGQLKKQIEHRIGLSAKFQRLFCKSYEMKDSNYLIDYINDEKSERIDRKEILNKYRLNYIANSQKISMFKKVDTDLEIQLLNKFEVNQQIGRIIQLKETINQDMTNILNHIQEGFNKGLKPLKIEEGLSGSYILRDRFHNNEAIFKCIDEEPFAPNNQKGYKGKFGEMSFRKGIRSGEVSLREVAAFYLDEERVHGVPETTLVEIYHPFFLENNFADVKLNQVIKKKSFKSKFIQMIQDCWKRKTKMGSLQKFENKNGNAGDISSSRFSVYEVQKIALLDLRVLNDDRNGENILFRKTKKNTIELIPIDHGLILPDNLEITNLSICWYFWKQIQEPIDPVLKQFILKLNPQKNAQMLKKKLDLRTDCLVNFLIAEIFLKKCVFIDLTISKIVDFMYREDEDTKSTLENLVSQAEFIFSNLKNSFIHNQFYFSKIIENSFKDINKPDLNHIFLPKTRKRIYSMNHNQISNNLSPPKTKRDFEDLEKKMHFSDKKKITQSKNLIFHKSFSFSGIELKENPDAETKDKFYNLLFFYYFECCVDNFLITYIKNHNIRRFTH